MSTAGTAPTRAERIPTRAASIGKKFGIIAWRAKPTVRRFRLPFAQRTADAIEIGSRAAPWQRLFRNP
jgi:hypothetical protein